MKYTFVLRRFFLVALAALLSGCSTLRNVERSIAAEGMLTPYKRQYLAGEISRSEYERYKRRILNDPHLELRWNTPELLKRKKAEESSEAVPATAAESAAEPAGVESLPLAKTYPMESEAPAETPAAERDVMPQAETKAMPVERELAPEPSQPEQRGRNYPRISIEETEIGPMIKIETH